MELAVICGQVGFLDITLIKIYKYLNVKAFTLIIFLVISVNVFAQVKVRGYTRSNGTYVQPHYRSNPDGNPYNNWSYPGNTNPYTGKVATGDPSTYLKNYFNNNEKGQSQYSNSSNQFYLPYTNTENTRTSQTKNSDDIDIIDLLRNSLSSNNYSVSVSSLNMRGGPSTAYPVIRSLSYNESVTVIESYTNGWKKVKYNTYNNLGYPSSVIGFVAGNYISNSNLGITNFSATDKFADYQINDTRPSVMQPSAPIENIQPVKPKEYNTSYHYTQPSAPIEKKQPVKSNEYSESYFATQPDEIKNHKFENGDIYIGIFNDSKMNGNGTYLWKNGDKYVGEFVDNKINGYGNLTKYNGEKHVGYFVNGALNGQGSITSNIGISYVGFFKNGQLNGYGSKIYANGTKENGYFTNGILKSTSNTTISDKAKNYYENLSQDYTEKVSSTKQDPQSKILDDKKSSNIAATENMTIAKTKNNEIVNYYGRYLFWTTFNSSYSYIPLREKIDLNSKIIFDCPQNWKVYVLEDLGNSQYKVFVNGNIGYVSSKYLKPISK